MKITMYELLGMVKEGKASDITTNFMFDRKKYNLLAFLDEYTLDINSLNWEIEILEEEKKIPEKIKSNGKEFYCDNIDSWIDKEKTSAYCEYLMNKYNDLIDYLKSKGE